LGSKEGGIGRVLKWTGGEGTKYREGHREKGEKPTSGSKKDCARKWKGKKEKSTTCYFLQRMGKDGERWVDSAPRKRDEGESKMKEYGDREGKKRGS